MAYLISQEVYNRQNRVIHKACTKMGYPYSENKDMWLSFFNESTGRKVKGLSEMTLGERRSVIKKFNRKSNFAGKNDKLYNPYVNIHQKDWKKGDPEGVPEHISRPVEVGAEKQPLISKISAILTELKYPWKYADAIAMSRFKTSVVEFLNVRDLHKVLKMLVINQSRKRSES